MNLSRRDWKTQLASDTNSVILDVRTDAEFNEGHIPDALHIDILKGQGFINELENLDTTKKYYVYCKSGGRSERACAVMNQMGFDHAYNLVGGIMEWDGEVVR
jgi:rhodanese-related sulfurtransferase